MNLKFLCRNKLTFPEGLIVISCVCSGNIRVYCRVRPFLAGQASRLSTVDHIDEGNITVLTPAKYCKEGRKSFTFNKVFGPMATQGWLVFIWFYSLFSYWSLSAQLLLLFPHRGGICRHSASDSVSSRWLQCMYICLWPNGIWKNFYHGKKEIGQAATAIMLCS